MSEQGNSFSPIFNDPLSEAQESLTTYRLDARKTNFLEKTPEINSIQPQILTVEIKPQSNENFNHLGTITQFRLTSPNPNAPSLLTTIEGINYDENATNNGNFFIPPDPSGAVGLNHLVSVVNSSIEWHTKAGVQQNSQSLSSFFASLSPATRTFDPKVIYDQYSGRFVVVTLEQTGRNDFNSSNDVSKIFLAASKTSDPNQGWNYYSIDAKVLANGSNSWADYPGFAIDDEAIYVTSNIFTFEGDSFQGSRLWVVPKSPFYGGTTPTNALYDPSTAAGLSSQAGTLQPAHMFGNAPTGLGTFLLSSGFSSGNNEVLSIIRINNPLGTPTFTNTFVNVGDISSTVSLPDANQLGTSTKIETNDPRLLNAVWRNNTLWTINTINPTSGTDAGQATAHWYKIDTSNLANLILADQGNIGGEDIAPGTATFFPSIAVDASNNIGINFSASASSIFPGAYYTGRNANDPAGTVQSSGVLKAGQDYYVRTFGGSSNRWGDYTAISVDPSNDSTFWAFNEYARTRGSVSGGEDGRWGTTWGSFTFTSPNTPGTLSFTQTSYSGLEGTSTGTISTIIATIQRTDGSVGAITVPVQLGSPAGTATAGSDYTNTFPITVSFADGETSKTVSIPVVRDSLIEPDETINFQLGTPTGGATLGTQTITTYTILDDDTPIFSNTNSITINDVSSASPYPSTINVSGLTGTITKVTVTLKNISHTFPDDIDILLVGPTGQKTILLSDVGNGEDLNSVNLTFDSTATVSLPDAAQITSGTYLPTDFETGDIFNSPAPAGPYQANLGLFNSTNPNGAWQLFVVDDTTGDVGAIAGGWQLNIQTLAPTLPTLSINDISITEGNSGTSNATFTVTLSAAATSNVTVNYGTANGTAIAGSDYTNKSGTLTFTPGQTSQTFTVPIIGDTAVEANETFLVNLTAPTNAILADSQGIGTILNDDTAPLPTLSINDISITEGNSGTSNATFTVTLSAAATSNVTVNYGTANGTAIAGSDYTNKSGTLTFTPGQTSRTITVPIIGDTAVEANETFLVNLTAPTNATLADAQGVGTIIDNDAVVPTLQFSQPSFLGTEGGSATTVTIIVNRLVNYKNFSRHCLV